MTTAVTNAACEHHSSHEEAETSAERRSNPYVGDDVRQLWRYMSSQGTRESLQRLHERSSWKSISALACDWMIIWLSVAAVVKFGIVMAPVAIVLIGSRQRALVVLAHEGAHGALHPKREVNDILAKYCACLPMFLDYSVFCKSHAEHHRYLGDPHKDTDFLHSEEDISRGWWFVYSKQFLSLDTWLSSGPLGGLRSADRAQRCLVALYWATLLALIAVVFSGTTAVTFLALWIVSRAVVHHAIISFVIISDHVGLHPGASILNFARNHSRTSPLRWLIHPHSNGLHLTHHLLPGLPFHSLAAADKLLMTWPRYREAAHCSSYFFGKNSAIRSWCGGHAAPGSGDGAL